MINDKIITALICECNPFHEGHKRIINKSKENGSLLVCIMSPDYVQRGEVAVLDKYKRTEILLKNGADLVVELPVEYVLSSAKYFAKASIYIAHKLGFVDNIIFGSYINDLDKLKNISNLSYDVIKNYENTNITINKCKEKIVDIEKTNTNNYYINKKIKEYLQKEISYPKALSTSMGIDIKSNDILNIEYLTALREFKSQIKPIVFERKKDIKGSSDIRKTMKNIMTIDNFSDYLNQILFYNQKKGIGYIDYYGIDESFNNSLMNISLKNMSFSDRVDKLSTKNRTIANVKRNLFHILLGIKKKDMDNKRFFSKHNYVRILGFNHNGNILIKKINIPYLLGYTKKELNRFDKTYYDHSKNRSILTNIYASDLYQFVSKNEIYEMSRKVVKL